MSERSFYPTQARLSGEAAVELAEAGDFLGAALHFRMAADYLVLEIWHRDRVSRAVEDASSSEPVTDATKNDLGRKSAQVGAGSDSPVRAAGEGDT